MPENFHNEIDNLQNKDLKPLKARIDSDTEGKGAERMKPLKDTLAKNESVFIAKVDEAQKLLLDGENSLKSEGSRNQLRNYGQSIKTFLTEAITTGVIFEREKDTDRYLDPSQLNPIEANAGAINGITLEIQQLIPQFQKVELTENLVSNKVGASFERLEKIKKGNPADVKDQISSIEDDLIKAKGNLTEVRKADLPDGYDDYLNQIDKAIEEKTKLLVEAKLQIEVDGLLETNIGMDFRKYFNIGEEDGQTVFNLKKEYANESTLSIADRTAIQALQMKIVGTRIRIKDEFNEKASTIPEEKKFFNAKAG